MWENKARYYIQTNRTKSVIWFILELAKTYSLSTVNSELTSKGVNNVFFVFLSKQWSLYHKFSRLSPYTLTWSNAILKVSLALACYSVEVTFHCAWLFCFSIQNIDIQLPVIQISSMSGRPINLTSRYVGWEIINEKIPIASISGQSNRISRYGRISKQPFGIYDVISGWLVFEVLP